MQTTCPRAIAALRIPRSFAAGRVIFPKAEEKVRDARPAMHGFVRAHTPCGLQHQPGNFFGDDDAFAVQGGDTESDIAQGFIGERLVP